MRRVNDQTVLLITIQLSISQQNKLFQVLLCITKNLIKHQSFVYKQLYDKPVLFQTIRFSMPFVYTQFKCQLVLFDH